MSDLQDSVVENSTALVQHMAAVLDKTLLNPPSSYKLKNICNLYL